MKKFFLSTMMFASMQFLSASENNDLNNSESYMSEDADSVNISSCKRAIESNDNPKKLNIEFPLLCNDDINCSSLIMHNTEDQFGSPLVVLTEKYTKYLKDHNAISFSYQLDDLHSALLTYYRDTDKVDIQFGCYFGNTFDIRNPYYQIDKKILLSSIEKLCLQYPIELVDELCDKKCISIEIKNSDYASDVYHLVFYFDGINSTLQSDFMKASEKTLDITLTNLNHAKDFIRLLIEFFDRCEMNAAIKYHLSEQYEGSPQHHIEYPFLQCETFHDVYKVAGYDSIEVKYSHNLVTFEFNIKNLEEFEKYKDVIEDYKYDLVEATDEFITRRMAGFKKSINCDEKAYDKNSFDADVFTICSTFTKSIINFPAVTTASEVTEYNPTLLEMYILENISNPVIFPERDENYTLEIDLNTNSILFNNIIDSFEDTKSNIDETRKLVRFLMKVLEEAERNFFRYAKQS